MSFYIISLIFSISDWRENRSDIYFVAPKPSTLKDEEVWAFHELLGYQCPDPNDPDSFLRQLENPREKSVQEEFYLQDTGDLTVRRKEYALL